MKRWHTNTIQQRDTAHNCTERSQNFWDTAGGSFKEENWLARPSFSKDLEKLWIFYPHRVSKYPIVG